MICLPVPQKKHDLSSTIASSHGAAEIYYGLKHVHDLLICTAPLKMYGTVKTKQYNSKHPKQDVLQDVHDPLNCTTGQPITKGYKSKPPHESTQDGEMYWKMPMMC